MNRPNLIAIALGVSLLAPSLQAQTAEQRDGDSPRGAQLLREADRQAVDPMVSPVQRIERRPGGMDQLPRSVDVPSVDGVDHNLDQPQLNATHEQLRRRFAPAYADGVSALAGADRPSAREVSNQLHAQDVEIENARGASDFLWQWGQFIDHDVDLTDGADPAELAPIAVPSGDAWFDPESSSNAYIVLNRSLYDSDTGLGAGNPRQQVNEITGWLDGSMVYGSDETRASTLRTFSDGRLATSEGDLLPFNTAGLSNAGGPSDQLFLAGDVRANEQIGLTAMHTLFMREHNWWAERIQNEQPRLSDEQIYQQARAMVIAEIQSITYREFLPVLLGDEAIAPYRGYDRRVDARIFNAFSTAAYRLGHSMLSPTLLRLGADNQTIDAGDLALRDAFFSPQLINEGGIEALLRGLAAQRCQELDVYVIDDIRNFLFGAPGSGGFDLASLNIQRGRDHGLPSYVEVRRELRLPRIRRFADINPDQEIQQRLAATYQTVEQIDLWSGLLAEAHVRGAMVGPTMQRLLADQFTALRDGDRFYFEGRMDRRQMDSIRQTQLSDIIRRNSDIGQELPDDVFVVAEG